MCMRKTTEYDDKTDTTEGEGEKRGGDGRRREMGESEGEGRKGGWGKEKEEGEKGERGEKCGG